MLRILFPHRQKCLCHWIWCNDHKRWAQFRNSSPRIQTYLSDWWYPHTMHTFPQWLALSLRNKWGFYRLLDICLKHHKLQYSHLRWAPKIHSKVSSFYDQSGCDSTNNQLMEGWTRTKGCQLIHKFCRGICRIAILLLRKWVWATGNRKFVH